MKEEAFQTESLLGGRRFPPTGQSTDGGIDGSFTVGFIETKV